ncbi:MAG: hypothetical protein Q9169_001792 [Polycauliona sp. 2 TL-2023]
MPRRRRAENDVPQNDGSGESKETPLQSTGEDQPKTTESMTSEGTEAVQDTPITGQSTAFTPVNTTNPNASPQISTPPRRPVERLASLNLSTRNVSRQSVETQQPGNPEQPKRLKVQPKSAVRRSKEDREATEKAEAERLHARLAATNTSSSLTGNRGGLQHRATIRGGLGGASRQWQNERYATSGAAGFLGGATPTEDKRRREVASRFRGGGRARMLTGLSREVSDVKSGPKVKKEVGIKKGTSKDNDGDTIMGGIGSARKKAAQVKKEYGGRADESSDDDFFELEDEGRKIDIERINLVSEDEVSDASNKGKSVARERTPRPPGGSLMLPIRIDRHDHEERIVSVNTEASSHTSAELRKRAKARGQAQGSLFLPETLGPIEDRTMRSKWSTKSKDVEFVRNERKWQGVYQDEDDNDGPEVKEEPRDDDTAIMINEAPSSSQTVTYDMLTQDGTSGTEDYAAPVRPRPSTKSPPIVVQPKPKLKSRGSKALRRRKPVLQTEEDHQEWQRYKKDILLLEDHLRMPSLDGQLKDLESDADGDIKIRNVDAATVRDRKHNTSFLFQLPPILPDVVDSHVFRKGKIKRKPVEVMSDVETHDAASTTKETPKETPKSKTNTDTKSKTSAPSSSTDLKSVNAVSSATVLPSSKIQSAHALPPQPTNPLPLGRLGTIKLDSTGFPSATWTSSFRLDLGRASDYGALQELVLLKSEIIALPPKKEVKGVVKQEEGALKEEGLGVSEKKAWAVGQMGGGFVMGPDWGWMFGDR